MTPGAGAADEVLALARLTYVDDGPGRWAAAEALLAEHPDLVAADPFVAAAVGDAEAVRRHLERDPAVATAVREDGWTALMCLTYARVRQRDPYATARLLLDAGADPDAGVLLDGRVPPFTVLTGCFGEGEQGPGRTPRHPQGDLLAGLLLERGADPHDGQTLYDRMFSRDDGHLRLLLAHGLGRGDGGVWRRRLRERQDSPRRMVALQVDWARDHGLTDRLALLAAHGFTDGTSPDEPSPWREQRPLPAVFAAATPLGVRRVVSEGADPDARAHGRTLLHHAAWIGDVELVTALLDVGADPQALDDTHGSTPLGWAEWAYADATAALLRPVTRAGRR